MGTDVHLHIEVKIADEWHHYAHPHVERDYKLFGMLADVRGSGKYVISPPKGLPNDMTVITYLDYSQIDSGVIEAESWLGLDEICLLSKQTTKILGCDLESKCLKQFFFGNSFSGLRDYPESFPSEIQDVRFVFWFDS